ncbi:SDR family NAD(P)-dependent oxidoreductase, partial [Thioclava sp. BHET1]
MNDPVTGQLWWIIGASEGLGRALAEALHRQGARLILSARNAERLDELAAALPGARVLPLDVTDPESCRLAAAEAGPVLGLIYCAGAYQPMTARKWDPEAAALMAETNLTGALRLLGHAVPAMIARGEGRIMLIGSLVGYRGLPG